MEVEEEEELPTEIEQKSLMLQVKYMMKAVEKRQGSKWHSNLDTRDRKEVEGAEK